MKTYNDIYLAARKRFREAGVEDPSFEARLILMGATGKTKEQFFRDINLYVADDFEEKTGALIARRASGEPLAYVTGEWEFYGLPLYVTPDVLIPRVDTEILAGKAIELLRRRDGGKRVLDLCCGSGCIGIAIASKVGDSQVLMVDKSMPAMSIARKNVVRCNVQRNVMCINADVMSTPPMLLGRFDMIVSNPPYIPTEDMIGLDPSVRDFEPGMALDGGKDGLDFYRVIVEKWAPILKDRGCMLFEVGIHQAEAVMEIMTKAGFTSVGKFMDTGGIDRVVAGIRYQDRSKI